MSIASISSVITSNFITRFSTANSSASSTFSLSGSDGASAAIKGLSSGVKVFSNAIIGLNGTIGYLNITRSDLSDLGKITDDMIEVVNKATQGGIGSGKRGEYNSAFTELVTKFQNVLSDSSAKDYDGLKQDDLLKIFSLLGFDKEKSTSFASLIKEFSTAENSDGSEFLASDKSQAARPYQIPLAAYQTQVNTLGTTGSGSFAVQTTGTEGGSSGYNDVTLTDINGDSKVDFVAINDSGFIVTRLGNGDGTFKADTTYTSKATSAARFKATDMNGDGVKDLVVVEKNNNSVYVLIGNSTGSFKAGVTYLGGASGTVNSSVDVASLTAGITKDVVYAHTSILIRLGNSDGTLNAANTYATGGSGTAGAVQLASINSTTDSSKDIIFSYSNGFGVLLNNGDGTFQAAVTHNIAGSTISDITVADFNGDGKNDVIATDSANGKIRVSLGVGDGTFSAEVSYSSGSGTDRIVSGDINGDAVPDVVVTNGTNKTVTTLLGNSNGTFKAGISSPLWESIESIAIGDIEGDGIKDLGIGTTSDRYELVKGLPTVTTSTAYRVTSRNYNFLFDAGRNILTRPAANQMLADLKALREQINTNLEATKSAVNFILDNVDMLRTVGYAFIDVEKDAQKTNVADAQEIASMVQAKIRNSGAGVFAQFENLDAISVASLTTTFTAAK